MNNIGMIKKIIGGWFVSMGATILFGQKHDWRTYYNLKEEEWQDEKAY